MTSSPQAHPIRKAPLFTPYVVIWSMFGALSLGFLMVLGLAPEWLDDLRPVSFGDPQSNQGQRAAARMAADLDQMKNNIAQVQLELSKVKTDVELQGTHQSLIKEQVASLETRISAGLPAAALETATPPTSQQQQAQTQAPAQSAQSGSSDAVKSPVKTLKVINADTKAAGAPLETGSVSGQAPKAVKAAATQAKVAADKASVDKAISESAAFSTAVTPAPRPLGVKISTGASVESLRLSWGLLAERHADALTNLEARYTTTGDAANPTYDLVAGPISSKADAGKVCKTLIQRGVPCTVSGFSGDALQ